MSLYNFSSVDPEHYNRIRTTIPNNFITRYVSICVSTFTSNCNIEVLNKNDYIEFEIRHHAQPQKCKVFCTDQYSRLSAASLPSLFEEWINKSDLEDEIKVSITNIDTIRFTCEYEFAITDMSYNMKLITGFYCSDESKWPIVSKVSEWEEEREEPVEIPIRSEEHTSELQSQ